MINRSALGVLLLVGCCIAACSSAGEPPAGPMQPLHYKPFYVTHVTLYPNGTHSEPITQKVTPEDGVDIQALTQVSCRGSNFALYDLPVGQNGPDCIAFTGTGQASLGDFSDPGTGTTWAGQAQSYDIFTESDGGTPSSGYFSESSDGYFRCGTFAPVTQQTNIAYVNDGIGVVNYVRNDTSSCPTISCMSGYFPCNYTCYGQESSECVPDSDCSGCDMEQWNSYCHTLLCTL